MKEEVLKKDFESETDDFIVLRLNTFLFNAGIVGLNYLLKVTGAIKGKDYKYDENGFEFYISRRFLLEKDLAKFYFDAHIIRFKEETRYTQVVNFIDTLESLTNEYKEKEDKKVKKRLDEIYKRIFDVLNSNSYKSGYEILRTAGETVLIEQQLKELKAQKDYKVKFQVYKEIYAFLQKESVKKTLCFKDIMYSRINMFWDGKVFFNRANVKKDMYNLYVKDFIEPLKTYLTLEKRTKKKKDYCIECGLEAAFPVSISFMKDSVDDIARKKSSFWNLKPDAYFCPICAFVYSLVPLGFIEVGYDMMFINNNDTIMALIDLNTTNKEAVADFRSNKKIFYVLNRILQNEITGKEYALNNIQVIVRKKHEDRYNLNILGTHIITILKLCRKDFEKLIGISIKLDRDNYLNVYAEVLLNLLNGCNQYLLINKLLKHALNVENAFSSTGYLRYILNIQITKLSIKGGKCMENNKRAYAMMMKGREFRAVLSEGSNLLEQDTDNKLRGFVYQLINALQVNNRDMFLNLVIRMYSGYGKLVPDLFINTFKSDDEFKCLGYAYILGLKSNKIQENKSAEKEEVK